MSLRLVVLDVNETLIDLEPLRERFTAVGAPAHLLDTWFASVLRDGFALALTDEFMPFRDVAVANLANLLRQARVSGNVEEAAISVVDAIAELPLHPDVPEGLRALRAAGLQVATMTNGSVATTEQVLAAAGLLDLVDRRLDVTGPRRWKPAPDSYRWAVAACDATTEQAALIATHPWDVHGAQHVGMRGAWLNRSGSHWPFPAPPDVEAATLAELARALAP